MKIQQVRLEALLLVIALAAQAMPLRAETMRTVKSTEGTSAIELAKSDMNRSTKSRSSGRAPDTTQQKEKRKKVPYTYLLPFGIGQFEQGKNIAGTALAAGQAGFLLMYFDRMQQIRNSNADAADVMKNVDTVKASNDPTIISFLDTNEAFVLKAQQEAKLSLLGFFALYSLGVAEAVFDPIQSMRMNSPGKRKKTTERSEALETVGTTRLVEELQQEQAQDKMDPRLTESKVGFFIQPNGSSGTIGLSVQKPF